MHCKLLWIKTSAKCINANVDVKVYDESHRYRATPQRYLPEPSLSLRCQTHGPLAKRLMHTVHLSGNTSVVSKSFSDWFNYTGFPGEVCVTFFNVLPGIKDAMVPNPSRKKKAVVFTNVTANTYQDQQNAGFSKVSEIFKVRGI